MPPTMKIRGMGALLDLIQLTPCPSHLCDTLATAESTPMLLKLVVRKYFPLTGIVQLTGIRGFWSTLYKRVGL